MDAHKCYCSGPFGVTQSRGNMPLATTGKRVHIDFLLSNLTDLTRIKSTDKAVVA